MSEQAHRTFYKVEKNNQIKKEAAEKGFFMWQLCEYKGKLWWLNTKEIGHPASAEDLKEYDLYTGITVVDERRGYPTIFSFENLAFMKGENSAPCTEAEVKFSFKLLKATICRFWSLITYKILKPLINSHNIRNLKCMF